MQKQTKEQRENRKKRRPELGSWHTITEIAKRFEDGDKVHWQAIPINDRDGRRGKTVFVGEGEQPKNSSHGKWSDWKWKPNQPITSYRAMYVGYRFKKNGERTIYRSTGYYADEYPEDISYLKIDETVEVWMFVTHENRNPIAVMPFDYPSEGE